MTDPTPDKGAVPAANLQAEAKRLSNGDIEWTGSTIGLVPVPRGEPARILAQAGNAAIAPLLWAVEDPARFVAAHVLLTISSGEPFETLPWNGLIVDIEPDGTVVIPPGQHEAISAKWHEWARNRSGQSGDEGEAG